MDVSKAIPTKTALPILENFLFVLKDNILEITASDQELTLRTSIEVTNSVSDGSIAVPARQLIDLLKNLVAASVLLSGLAAFGIVKTATPDIQTLENVTPQGQTTRTVNLSLSDYPDFTYAAENAVEAVVYVKVTVKSRQQQYIDPFFRFFFGDENMQSSERVRQGSGSGVREGFR